MSCFYPRRGRTFEVYRPSHGGAAIARRDAAAGSVIVAYGGESEEAIEVALDEAEEAGRYLPSDVAALLESSDWVEAMPYATHFGWLDIGEVIAKSEGENDGPHWVALFRLRDGRFGRLSAGCDYTGWG